VDEYRKFCNTYCINTVCEVSGHGRGLISDWDQLNITSLIFRS